MENLNAENIINEIQSLIKALKDCGGWVKRGNGEGWFNHEILADALALINSQEQRIKELTVDLEAMRGAANSYKMHNKELTEENERLKSVEFTCGFVKPHKVLECPIFDEIARTKADTVRKMQTEIKKTFSAICKGEMGDLYRIIDQIAKEMLEGEK